MSNRDFRSFGSSPRSVNPRNWNEAEVVAIAQALMLEHAEARQKAITEANLVCGECAGTGVTKSVLMPGEVVPCIPCTGTGQPNEHAASMPALTHDDHTRMWKIGQLLKGRHRVAVLQVIKEAMPELYKDAPEEVKA